MPATFDPVATEVWRNLFESVAEEMGATLERTGYSPNIKERRDHSCALFDRNGRLIAQAAHIPVHLGAMPLMMERLLEAIPAVARQPGSMWLCNDPEFGGTHLPDLTLVAPVFHTQGRQRRNLVGFVANRAHHADVGGMAPGSMATGTELFQEGLILSPVRLVAGGRVQTDVLELVCANSRTPHERRGDLAAQIAANRTGASRLLDLIQAHGEAELTTRHDALVEYAARIVRAALAAAPDGEYAYSDLMDDDGVGNRDMPIEVVARLRAGFVEFDFTGTAPETVGPINAPEAVTRSACYYAVRCLVGEETPTNAGAFAPVRVVAPEGTLVNSSRRRAVAAGNVETSQRIVDVVLGALAGAFPNRIPAASQGTMNNLLIGGYDPIRERSFTYYETIGGGAGASASGRGASAVHSHMTNTRNTPIEALEMHYPLRVRQYALRTGSGGDGQHKGGDGIVRSVELLAPAHISLMSERRVHAPPGVDGGCAGATGRNTLTTPSGASNELPGKYSGDAPAGAAVTIETPGGGGWGAASKRGPG